MGDSAEPLRREVLLASRRRCDDMHDGPEARDAMQRDVLATPAELLPDLLAAFSIERIDRALLLIPTTEPKE